MKYRLLRDCPHGKAGSEWERLGHSEWEISLGDKNGRQFFFPVSTFSDWFKPIVEMEKFTKDQVDELKEKVGECLATIREIPSDAMFSLMKNKFSHWLDENTEK